MFVELEDKIVDVLRSSIKEVPKENIIANGKVKGQPSINVSNIAFKIERPNLSEDEEGEKSSEVFNGTGSDRRFVLKEKPSSIIGVESPKGKELQEWDHYTVNVEEGLVIFRDPPAKGAKNIVVNYVSKTKKLKVVRVKIKAKYNVIVSSIDRKILDKVTESIIKSLIRAEKDFEKIGVTLKPAIGKHIADDQVSLIYYAEFEIESAEIIPPIEKIEIKESHEM